MLGETHLRTLTIRGFPNLSRPGILDALNHQDFAFRWMTRFIALDKTEATKTLTKLRRQWFAKRKSVTALLREVLYNESVQLLDSDADNKVADADLALQTLGGDRRLRLSHHHHHDFGWRSPASGREGPRDRADRQRARLHDHPRERQRRGGVAQLASRSRLRQRPPTSRSHAQSRASDATVLGLGRSGPEHSPGRAAAALCRDFRLDAVSPLHPCRRCRPHAGGRSHGRWQIGAARTYGAAIPPLCRLPNHHLR